MIIIWETDHMAPKSIIIGSIDGISKENYADMKSELKECFDKISWKDSQLIIKSEKRHTKLKTLSFGFKVHLATILRDYIVTKKKILSKNLELKKFFTPFMAHKNSKEAGFVKRRKRGKSFKKKRVPLEHAFS